MLVDIGLARRKVEPVESAEVCANPHCVSLAVEVYNLEVGNVYAADTFYLVGTSVEHVHAAAFGAYPQASTVVLRHTAHNGERQTGI